MKKIYILGISVFVLLICIRIDLVISLIPFLIVIGMIIPGLVLISKMRRYIR